MRWSSSRAHKYVSASRVPNTRHCCCFSFLLLCVVVHLLPHILTGGVDARVSYVCTIFYCTETIQAPSPVQSLTRVKHTSCWYRSLGIIHMCSMSKMCLTVFGVVVKSHHKNDRCECMRYAQLKVQTHPHAINTATFFFHLHHFRVLILFCCY